MNNDTDRENKTEEWQRSAHSSDGVPDPWLGRRLLDYEIENILGQGGMSVVYHAFDHQLHRSVALKILHPFLAQRAECQARLVREARAVARLKHPNILEVFNYAGHESATGVADPSGIAGTRPSFVVAEFVPGVTLKTFLERHRIERVPEAAAYITWVLACALAHAHERGVIHRDLKPENVMVRDDGVLKLMDFGIAHIVDQEQLTVTGTLLGSPAHMAPECIEGHAADARSDLFSLGTMLYWMTTGHLPFVAPTPHALLRAIVEVDCVPPQVRSPRISDGLARIIHRSMAKNPDARYASAAEFANDLEEFLREVAVEPSFATVETLLRDPAAEMAQLAERVRAAHLQQARCALEQGAPARAIAALSRVIATDASDPDAHALLDAAHELDTGDAPQTTPGTSAVPGLVSAEAPAARRVSSRIGPALLSGAILVLIVAAAAVAGWVDAIQNVAPSLPDGVAPRASVQLVQAMEAAAPSSPPVATVTGTKEAGTSSVRVAVNGAPPKGQTTKTLQEPPKAAQDGNAKTAAALALDATSSAAQARPRSDLRSRQVTIRVWPFADIAVDGAQVARQVTQADVALSPGEHLLRFTHPFAKSKEFHLRVPARGELGEVRVRLDEAKPAFIRVQATPDAAEIAVNGQPKGNAAQSLRAPIVVPFPSLTAESTFQVIVFKKGYRTQTISARLRAGETSTLRVVLEPDANDAELPSNRVPLGTPGTP